MKEIIHYTVRNTALGLVTRAASVCGRNRELMPLCRAWIIG
jgi:hypothetical protein